MFNLRKALVTASAVAMVLGTMGMASAASAAPRGASPSYESRAQFLYNLEVALNVQPVYPSTPDFTDVPPTSPYYGYVEAAYQAGWVNGVGHGMFDPNGPLTRAAAAKIEVLALGDGSAAQKVANQPTKFLDDSSIPSWARGYIVEAVQLGLLKGYPDGTFRPNQDLSVTDEGYLIAQLKQVLASETVTVTASATNVAVGQAVTLKANVPYVTFSVNSQTATISGDTFVASAPGSYTVTGTNPGGASGTVTITVAGVTSVSQLTLTVSGQTVGTGAPTSPAIAPVGTGVTVSVNAGSSVGGLPPGAELNFLVSTSNNITATSNGQTLVASNLSAPIVIGNTTYKAEYTVAVAANGQASVTFNSTASSTQVFSVLAQEPVAVNGQPVQSQGVEIQWGVPGTLILSPLYSTSPDQLNFSSGANPTIGLVPVVATILPANASQTVSGQVVKFTMTFQSQTAPAGAPTAFFTTSNGQTPIAGTSQVSAASQQATDVATTDTNGQALVYVNSNVPVVNGVPQIGDAIQVSVNAQLASGGMTTTGTLLQWRGQAQPAQVANVSPSQALNAPGSNGETATSGTDLTFSGTLEDATGNPVPNATLVITDWQPYVQTSNNLDTDSFIPAGSTTPVVFRGTSYDIVQTDQNGNFQFTVTATVPVTQSVQNSINTYYISYAPPSVAVVEGQSLPSGLTTLSITGASYTPPGATMPALTVEWQQGQTVQAVGVNHNFMQTQYAALSDVPTTFSFSQTVGATESLYVAAFNQNAEVMVGAPTNQFAGYTFNWTITAPSGISIVSLGNDTLPAGATEVQFTVSTSGVTTVTGYALNGGAVVSTSQAAGTFGSGEIPFAVTAGSPVSGTVSASVTAYQNGTAEGAAAGTITANFTAASALTSLGVAGSYQNIVTYGPLITQNAAPPNSVGISGQAYGTGSASASNSATFVVAPFNNVPNLAAIPSQGLSYFISANNNGKIFSVDGYAVPGTPQGATVTIQPSGVVSVNNVNLWSGVGGNVVAFAQGTDGNTYILTQSGTTFDLYNAGPTSALGSSAQSQAPTLVATYTAPQVGAPNAVLEYVVTGNLLTEEVDTGANALSPETSSAGQVTGTLPGQLTLQPVQAATVQVADQYAETTTVTVTNSVNGQKATASASFISTTGNLANVLFSPASVSAALNSAVTVQLETVDQFGNPVPNATVYLSATAPYVWITQVNGQTITSTVNMGSSTSTNFQTEATPVPLFNVATTLSETLDYGSVSQYGLTAYSLTSAPVVTVTTGTNGTATLTLEDGNVTYVTAVTGSAATFQVSPAQAESVSIQASSVQGGASIGTLPLVFGTPSAPTTGVPAAVSVGLATTTPAAGAADTVTVTVTDSQGNPVANEAVSLATTGSLPATGLSPASGTTNASGQLVATFTGSAAGQTGTIVATAANGVSGVSPTVTVGSPSSSSGFISVPLGAGAPSGTPQSIEASFDNSSGSLVYSESVPVSDFANGVVNVPVPSTANVPPGTYTVNVVTYYGTSQLGFGTATFTQP